MPIVDKYEEINILIKANETWIDGFAEKGKALGVEREAAKTKIKELEISWNEQKCKIDKNIEAANILVRVKRQKDAELATARQELTDQIHLDELNALISAQPNFEDALRGQIDSFAEKRFEGLSFEDDPAEPKKVADTILSQMGAFRNFAPHTIDWRSAKAHYEIAIREICDAKLKGKQITSEQANSRFGAIQNCLRAQETFLFR